jgi:hypothetical protein
MSIKEPDNAKQDHRKFSTQFNLYCYLYDD